MQRWREARETGYDSEKWARLELELGRFAQGASLVSGFFLVLTAFIASTLSAPPWPLVLLNFRNPNMALWLPLLLTSFGVAGFTVAKKLGPYRLGYRSVHFVSSVGAFAVSIVFLLLAMLDHFAIMDLGVLAAWMFPGSVLGTSLAFVSLAVTWEGFGWRKGASIVASLFVPASLLPFAFVQILTTPDYRLLLLVYMYDALAIGFSGSLLHLIASAGNASQREILKASDAKVTQLKQEMVDRLHALEYKEKAYVDREAHLDAKQKDLLDIEAELNARDAELKGVQGKFDVQGRTLGDLESRLAKMRAEVESRVEELSLREKELKSTRAHEEESRRALADRETALAGREKELKRAQIDVSSRQRATEAKASQLADLEVRLKKGDKDIDARRNEVIRNQKELELKESEVKLKIKQLEAQQTTESREKMAQLREWESKVLAKEKDLGHLEVKVRQAQAELTQQTTDADAYAAALQQERTALEAREQELNAREKKLSDLASLTDERKAEIERRWKEAKEAQKRVQGREAEYNSLFKDAKLREADFSTTKEEVARKVAAMRAKETEMATWKADLEAETRKLNQKLREMIAREKALETKESDLSLKELEMTTKEREASRMPAAGGTAEVDRDRIYELRERAFREKDDEFKRRVYQREKELEAREMALREQLKAAASAPGAEATETTIEISLDRGDKLKTGTARLDDLLYGGLPMNANVLFIGPAFVGKEVGILNFIAEGLRANVPSVLVTTSKPPVEIAKEMAPVLPTFLEYEQLGLVRWIDASGTTPTKKMTRDGHTYRVPNATDFDGIMAALNEADEEFRKRGAPYFRFAFLTLSSSLTQADDKTALGFVQRFVNRLRQSKCVAAFALERGMHTDQQVESLQQLMDGALHFKQDKAKTVMSVVGIGEVQTRDWVPYKFTNKSLMIGSFQLERIR